jgi:hypothetical protein
MSERNFFAELKRRNVLRAAAFYAACAWLLVQVATQVFPFFHIAEWVVRWIVVAAVIGFPFAMLFSWFYEWTPHGLQRESEIARNESITRQTGRKLDRWIIAILASAVVLLLANQFVLHRDENKPAATVAGTTPIPGKSIAVLPFSDLSSKHDQESFSDGMAEEILNALARIKNLKVVGRASSFHYKGKDADLKTIGADLGEYVSSMLLRLGEPERSFEDFEHSSTGLSDAYLNWLWYPDAWSRKARQSAAFQGFAKRIGLVDYWKKNRWPDLCSPTPKNGSDAFTWQ